MKSILSIFLFLSVAGLASSAGAQSPAQSDGLAGFASILQMHEQAAAGPAMTLDDVERIALEVNPEIQVAARRVAIAQAHRPVAGALDDPMAMYRGWGVPLSQPWNYNAGQNMFGLSQTFPGRGKRALQTSLADSDIALAKAQLDQVRLDVRVRARKAFDDLLRAQEEMHIHDQHVGIARQAIQAARIKYAVGKVPQQDILKAQVELTRLTEHMIRFDHDAELARARINTLLGRSPASPLHVRGQFAIQIVLPSMQDLQEQALQARPDLIVAREAAERSRKEQALAKKAYVPDFTVSAGYMLMPSGTDMRNSYMVEGTMNLPWLNRRKHDAEIAASTARTTEQDAEFANMRNAAFGQIQEALVEVQSAQRLAHMYHDDLRPQAVATLQASVIAYENDKTEFLDLLDSQMTVIDIDLAWLQAVADFDARLADLELATGSTLEPTVPASMEVQP